MSVAVDVRAGRLARDARWLALPLTLLAAALGAAAVVSPLAALVAAAALLYIALAFHDLAAGVALFATVTFLEALPGVAATELGAIKAAGLVLVLSALRRSGTPVLLKERPALAFGAMFLAAWALSSSLWARDPDTATGSGVRLLLDVALLFIVFAAVRSARDARWLVWGYIGGAAASAVVGFFSATYAADTGRLAGGLGDPNFLAAMLVPALVLSVFALSWTKQAALRWLLAGCILLFAVALFLTQSRGGLVALAVALLAALVYGGSARRHFAVLATLVAMVGIAYYAAFASSTELERLLHPGGGTGRSDLWSVAARVIGDHPVVGVGAGNFPLVAPEYAAETINLPAVHLLVDRPQVVHNTYLGVFADLGVVGLITFVLVVGTVLALARRSARLFARMHDTDLELVSRAVFVSLVGMLAAFVFLSGELEKQLWLLLGLAVALDGLAHRRARAAAGG